MQVLRLLAGLAIDLARGSDRELKRDRFVEIPTDQKVEWALNDRVSASHPRDMSTPLAFARSLRKVLFGGGIAPADGRRLANLMRNCRNLPNRIRAGVPKDWDVGVKPGANDAEGGAFSDVGFFKREGGRMQVLAVFIEAHAAGAEACETAIASIARIVATRA